MAESATRQNADSLTPEVLRNEIVSNIDQMERVQMGGGSEGYASAMSVFPTVNMNDPEEGWWLWNRVKDAMQPTVVGAESPEGTLKLPDKRSMTTHPYKKKYVPEKGAQTRLGNTPVDVFNQAASEIRTELFLTRERVAWLGDIANQGMTGRYGQTPHPEVQQYGFVQTAANSWSSDAAEIYDTITNVTYHIMNNGLLGGGNVTPVMYVSPSVMRDIKRSQDFKDRISGVRIQSVTEDLIMEILDTEIGEIRRVMVFLPRKNSSGQYIDETGAVVQERENAARDNVLEPYDPNTDSVTRNVLIGRPGGNSAFIPWFSDELAEKAAQAPARSRVAVDDQRGFITQKWTQDDPLVSTFKGMQSIGFEVSRGENWGIIQDV